MTLYSHEVYWLAPGVRASASWLHRDWCLRPSDLELVGEYELETNHSATQTTASNYTLCLKKNRTLEKFSNISNKAGPISIIFGKENRQ